MAMHSTSRKPRLHRLPIRTDYVLIPAPLDLSLPEIAQKSAIPPIIVTPSSPSSTRDFSLAFLPDPPKPTLRERFQKSFFPPSPEEVKLFPIPLTTAPSIKSGFTGGSLRTRSILALLLVLFLATCHFVAHRLAVHMDKPYIEFAIQNVNANAVPVHAVVPGETLVQGYEVDAHPVALSWFNFHSRIVGNSVAIPGENEHVDAGSEAVGETTSTSHRQL